MEGRAYTLIAQRTRNEWGTGVCVDGGRTEKQPQVLRLPSVAQDDSA